MGKNFRTYALLTFVTDVEKEQMLSLFDWEVFYLKNDNGTYYHTFIERDGDKLPVVAVGQKEKGSIASATLVMKCIDLFRPEYDQSSSGHQKKCSSGFRRTARIQSAPISAHT